MIWGMSSLLLSHRILEKNIDMPTFTKVARPSGSSTKVSRPTAGSEGRFGIGKFGSARFGHGDAWQAGKVARPSGSSTKVARPS